MIHRRHYDEATLRAMLELAGNRGKVLSAIIGKTSPGGVLCAYQRDLADETGLTPDEVRGAMEELRKAGLCVKLKRGIYHISALSTDNRPVGVDN